MTEIQQLWHGQDDPPDDGTRIEWTARVEGVLVTGKGVYKAGELVNSVVMWRHVRMWRIANEKEN